MYCLDANIWIYYLDETLEEHDTVVGILDDVVENEPLFTTTVVQMEVVHYLHTQLTEATDLIDKFLFLEDVLVAELSSQDVETASTILQSHPNTGIGGRDATILAAMDRFDSSHLLTHDEGMKRVGDNLEWLTVTDPVTDGRH